MMLYPSTHPFNADFNTAPIFGEGTQIYGLCSQQGCFVVVLGDNLLDALSYCADEGLLDAYKLDDETREEYNRGGWEYAILGNYCEAFDLNEYFTVFELENFCRLHPTSILDF